MQKMEAAVRTVMKVPRRYLLALLPLVAVLLLVSAGGWATPVRQPVAFSHLKHAGDLELSCELCHAQVLTGRYAGLPGKETCALCHQTLEATSAESEHLKAVLAQQDPLHFNKLFRLPAHVYFSHRRHVGPGTLDCESCHGAIAVSQRPPGRALMRITMDFCLDCHRASGQSLDCVACHR